MPCLAECPMKWLCRSGHVPPCLFEMLRIEECRCILLWPLRASVLPHSLPARRRRSYAVFCEFSNTA